MGRSGYPTFITVNPDGTVTYDFDGHIHADGLDLDALTDANLATDDNQVRFLYGPTGEVVSVVTGFSSAQPTFRYHGTTHTAIAKPETTDPPGWPARATAQMSATNADRSKGAAITTQWNEDNTAIVYTSADTLAATILRSDGRSDFANSFLVPINQNGPLPIAVNYTSRGGASPIILFGGSGFAPAVSYNGIDLWINGTLRALSYVYFNSTFMHLPTVPKFYFPGSLGPRGTVNTFELLRGSPGGVNFGTDANDSFYLMVIERSALP